MEIELESSAPRLIADRYEIIHEIGKGGMGVVYRAADKKLMRHVALKTLKFEKSLSLDDIEVQRMVIEAQAAAQLNHPNIVTIYDIGIEKIPPYIALELVEGITLTDIIRGDELPDFNLIIKIMIQLCDGMAHAHERGIVHRDLKPSNVMLTDKYMIKITDFGLAKMVEDIERTVSEEGAVVGTPPYISPERYKGEKGDYLSDIFAIGVIMYELVTGKKPFAGDTVVEVMSKIINVEHEPLKKLRPSTPDYFEEIIAGTLAKDPSKRIQSASLIKEMLVRKAGASETISVHAMGLSLGDSPVWSLPYNRDANFTGREEVLREIQEQFSGKDSSSVVALHGLGGIGKTLVAIEYAYQHSKEYKLVWWLRAEENSLLLADFAELARSLGLPEGESKDREKIALAVKHCLEQNEDWLLIFDNASNPKDIKEFIPRGGVGNILVTSRNPNWRKVGHTVLIDKFKREESVEFLGKWLEGEALDILDNLAFALGDLPLALEQASAYIETTGISVSDYLILFSQHHQELLRRGSGPEESVSVASTWELSFAKIFELSPQSIELMNLCAFLAPENISKKLLSDGVKYYDEPLKSALSNPLSFNDAIAVLRSYSLVNASGDSLTFHKLVQSVIRDGLAEEEREYYARRALGLVRDAFRFVVDDTKTWDECSKLLPHSLTVVERCRDLDIAREDVGLLLNEIGHFLMYQGQYKDAKSCLESALKVLEGIYGHDDPRLSPVINRIGVVYREMGDREKAFTNYERSYRINKERYGEEHPDVGRDLYNIGLLFFDQGDNEKSLDYVKRAYLIFEKVYDEDHIKVIQALNLLGLIYLNVGEVDNAKKHIEESLRLAKERWGEKHPMVANRLTNLGRVYHHSGELEKARQFHEKALTMKKEFYGDKHIEYAASAHQLGSVLGELGEKERAMELFMNALEVSLNVLGEGHEFVEKVRKSIEELDS